MSLSGPAIYQLPHNVTIWPGHLSVASQCHYLAPSSINCLTMSLSGPITYQFPHNVTIWPGHLPINCLTMSLYGPIIYHISCLTMSLSDPAIYQLPHNVTIWPRHLSIASQCPYLARSSISCLTMSLSGPVIYQLPHNVTIWPGHHPAGRSAEIHRSALHNVRTRAAYSADGNYEVRYKSNVLVHPNGEVLWIPPAIYQVKNGAAKFKLTGMHVCFVLVIFEWLDVRMYYDLYSAFYYAS